MIREAKIGLLVGLAFIIVVGILISNFYAQSMQPPPAPQSTAGNDVRRSTVTPGAPSAMAIETPKPAANVQPESPVPTPGDLSTPTAPKPFIQIGAASNGDNSPRIINIGSTADNTAPQPLKTELAMGDNPPAPTPSHGGDSIDTELVQVPDHGLTDAAMHNNHDSAAGSQEPAIAAGAREYKAGSGDTVSRMASKFYGSNTKTHRDLIIKANSSLQKDPHKVVIGQAYVIPALPGAAGPSEISEEAVANGSAMQPAGPAQADAAEVFYTTKAGDNLWKIAKEQVGSIKAMEAIREMNRDVLRGSDAIKPNMKLRLPPKAVASAANSR